MSDMCHSRARLVQHKLIRVPKAFYTHSFAELCLNHLATIEIKNKFASSEAKCFQRTHQRIRIVNLRSRRFVAHIACPQFNCAINLKYRRNNDSESIIIIYLFFTMFAVADEWIVTCARARSRSSKMIHHSKQRDFYFGSVAQGKHRIYARCNYKRFHVSSRLSGYLSEFCIKCVSRRGLSRTPSPLHNVDFCVFIHYISKNVTSLICFQSILSYEEMMHLPPLTDGTHKIRATKID